MVYLSSKEFEVVGFIIGFRDRPVQVFGRLGKSSALEIFVPLVEFHSPTMPKFVTTRPQQVKYILVPFCEHLQFVQTPRHRAGAVAPFSHPVLNFKLFELLGGQSLCERVECPANHRSQRQNPNVLAAGTVHAEFCTKDH